MKNYCFLFILLVFLSCKEEQEIPPNNNSVEVESISAEVLSTGGVTLKGFIKNVELELDYGFIIYTNSTPTPSVLSSILRKRITGLHNGNFEMTFKNDLYNTQNYYYRAFAYTSNKTILGEEKEFASVGSSQPIIKELIPELGYINDTVTVVGKCFSENITLSLNDIKVTPLKVNDSLIKFIVPSYPFDRRYDNITIRKRTGEQVKYDNFGIHIPEVHSITPNPAYDTDTLTITGNHFDLRKDANSVFIGNYHKLEILESSRTTLKVKGPGAFSDFEPRFKIRAQHTEIDVYNKLAIILPEVTSVSKVIKYNTPFTIKGSNFPYTQGCSFTFRYTPWLNKGVFLEPIKCYRDSLIVTLNKASYLKDFYQNEVTTKYFDVEKTYFSEYYIDEPIIRTKEGHDIIKTHTYNGNLYAFYRRFNSNDYYIAKYDDDEKTFFFTNENKIDDSSVREYTNRTFYKNMYYYLIRRNDESILYGYNFIEKRNYRLNAIPSKNKIEGFVKGFGDYLYYGFESTVNNLGENVKVVWRYSIKDDKWDKFVELDNTEIGDKSRPIPLVFFLNNSIYIGSGNRNLNDLYAIDLASKTLSNKKSLPFSLYNTNAKNNNSFIIKDNKLLYFYNSFYQYDPDLDEWTILDAFRKESFFNLNYFKFMHYYKDELYGYTGSMYKFNNNYF